MKPTLAPVSPVPVLQASALSATGSERRRASRVLWARAAVRAIWLVLTPLLLAVLAHHYLFPSAFDAASTLPEFFSRFSNEQPVAVVVVLFLLFATLLRYWRFYLPGLRRVSALSWQLPLSISAAQLRAFEPYAEQLEALNRKGIRRSIARLDAERRAALEVIQQDLRGAFAEGDLSRAQVTSRTLAKLVAESKMDLQERVRLLGSLTGVVLLVLFVRSSVLEPFRVLSGSMLPTLEPGDWILANKLSYGLRLPFVTRQLFGRVPSRGDVIAFDTPASANAGQPARLVKRVIGLPGDRIGMHHGRPVINGVQVPSCDAGVYAYLSADAAVRGRLEVEFLGEQAYLTVYFAGSEPFVGYDVKPGEVFVLGDNRDNSSDSRAWGNHQGSGLPLGAIEGRVTTILIGTSRNERADWSQILKPLRREVRLAGVDTSEIRAGIERCLSNPPNASAPHP